MVDAPITKDSSTEENHINLLNMSFTWHGKLCKEMRPKKMGKPGYFMLGLMKGT
jgi:hypothetical protein